MGAFFLSAIIYLWFRCNRALLVLGATSEGGTLLCLYHMIHSRLLAPQTLLGNPEGIAGDGDHCAAAVVTPIARDVVFDRSIALTRFP